MVVSLFLISLISTLVAQQVNASEIMLERIRVQSNASGARFVGRDSGKVFTISGFNYIRLRQSHATFEADTEKTEAAYDAQRAEAMFAKISRNGYNTVRVFITGRHRKDPGIAGNYDRTQSLYPPYMENFCDFLQRATLHGIRVLPTFGDGEVPLNAYYRERFTGLQANNKNILF